VIQVVALADNCQGQGIAGEDFRRRSQGLHRSRADSEGPVTRVRVGPYASREAAEKGREQLQRLQLDGKVVPR